MLDKSFFRKSTRSNGTGPMGGSPLIKLLLGLLVLFSTVIQANACELSVLQPPIFPVIDYDVFAFSEALGSTEFTLRNDAEEDDCEFSVAIQDNSSAPPPFHIAAAELDVVVIIPQLLLDAQQPPVNGAYAARLEAGETRSFTVDFVTDQHIVVPAGSYDVAMVIQISDSTGAQLLDEFVGEMTLIADPRAQLNIAGTAGAFGNNRFSDMLLFEDPEIGDSQRVYIQMRSNAQTTLSLSSRNDSVMQHVSLEDSSIGYSLELSGQSVDLTSEVLITDYPATNLDGLSLQVTVRIDEFNQTFAGEYRDTINVTVTTQ